jgi:hypothetical protein
MKKFIGKPYAGKPHVRFDEGAGKVFFILPALLYCSIGVRNNLTRSGNQPMSLGLLNWRQRLRRMKKVTGPVLRLSLLVGSGLKSIDPCLG